MRKRGYAFLAVCGVLVVAGCTAAPTRLEADYGTAFHAARVHQTLLSGAGQNVQPVEGFDGKAAQETIQRYREAFAKPPPPPAFTISVGATR